MTLAQASPAAQAKPTPDRLLDAPLDVLLAETGAEIFDCSITDAAFFGAFVQRKGGPVTLALPTGRSELEHDTMARYLLAQVFDVDLPKLPAPFITTEV